MREEEFTTVLREHAGLLSRVAASYEADPALRDDLLQDMALALWRGLPTWRGDAPLKAFIARIAHNRGATHGVGQLRRSPSLVLSEQLEDLKHGPTNTPGSNSAGCVCRMRYARCRWPGGRW
jgi:RNA polymerase sigma-70 factor (ECF subfamily)